MKSLFIYCSGGFGREVLKMAKMLNEINNTWSQIYFIDDNCDVKTINDCKVLRLNYVLENFNNSECEFVIANGDPYIRKKIYDKFKSYGLTLVSIISPDVDTSGFIDIESGCIICKGVNLTENIKVKECTVINCNCSIFHDVVIDEFCTISPSVNVCGNVKIGKLTYVGVGATIRDEISIGSNSIIGMGSLVTKNIGDNVVAYGFPCKEIKKNVEHKIFK